jgi:hypothetical protein
MVLPASGSPSTTSRRVGPWASTFASSPPDRARSSGPAAQTSSREGSGHPAPLSASLTSKSQASVRDGSRRSPRDRQRVGIVESPYSSLLMPLFAPATAKWSATCVRASSRASTPPRLDLPTLVLQKSGTSPRVRRERPHLAAQRCREKSPDLLPWAASGIPPGPAKGAVFFGGVRAERHVELR